METRELISMAEGRVGTLFAQNYLLTDVLGVGGNGVVFAATHKDDGRRFALKYIVATRSTTFARFALEVSALCRLNHPHTVRIFDWGEVEEGAFMAMEYLEGESLQDRLTREGGVLDAGLALEIAHQVMLALKEAHEQGIVHRDLKPANIYLVDMGDERAFVKLLDFGIAKSLDDSPHHITKVGHVVGSPLYISPEQVRGEWVDHRADFYGVGCVLCRMLGGRPPFEGTSSYAILKAHAADAPPLLNQLRRERGLAVLPEPLEAFVMRLLAKQPAERPAAAQELIDTLHALRDELATALPPKAHHVLDSPSTGLLLKKPAAAKSAAMVAVGLLMGVGYLGWVSSHTSAQEESKFRNVAEQAMFVLHEGRSAEALTLCAKVQTDDERVLCERVEGMAYKNLGSKAMACPRLSAAYTRTQSEDASLLVLLQELECEGFGRSGQDVVAAVSSEDVEEAEEAEDLRRPDLALNAVSDRPAVEPHKFNDVISHVLLRHAGKERAAQLRARANKKLFSGDTKGAITDCREALRGGAVDCHRIMAIAYKAQGNKSKACASFQKALRTAPSKAPIQAQVDKLKCK